MPRWHENDGDYATRDDLEERECAQGEWCRGYRIVDQRRVPALTPRVFCEPCTRLIGRSLDELPELYVRLSCELGQKGQAPERVSGSREAPVPPRLDVDALMRRMVSVMASWDQRVRAVAGLTHPGEELARKRRHGRALAGYTETLALRLAVLLSLPSVPMRRDIPIGEVTELDEGLVHVGAGYATVIRPGSGETAGREILELHRQARGKLAETRLREHLDVPCPGCDCLSLERISGSDQAAECSLCGRQMDSGAYTQWVNQYAAYMRARQRAVEEGVIPAWD